MPTSSTTAARVREYYRENQPFYNALWTEPRTLSMNFGLWTPGTRSHREALANQTRLIEELLRPAAGNRVLESGCGVGGACIWLASRHAVTVTGITLCPRQAAQAVRHARARRLNGRTTFAVMDFTQTAFPDAAFARIFASESVCHAEKKEEFVNEAFRLLQPGGRLVVIDGFIQAIEFTARDRQLYVEWCRGWAVPNLATVTEFDRYLRQAGFTDISYGNLIAAMGRSSRRIRRLGRVLYPILSSLQHVGLATRSQVDNARACLRQYHLVRRGLCGLGAFCANKPVEIREVTAVSEIRDYSRGD